MILACRALNAEDEMDTETSVPKPSRKRPLGVEMPAEEAVIPLLLTAGPSLPDVPASPESEPDGKKAKATQESDTATPALLAHLQVTYHALPEDTERAATPPPAEAPVPAAEPKWELMKPKAGDTQMLHCVELGIYRCPNPGCDFERPGAMGGGGHPHGPPLQAQGGHQGQPGGGVQHSARQRV